MDAAWYTIVDRSGIHRWPAVPLELAFNLLMAGFALMCWRRQRFQGQLFHVYLMAYGIFRFAHEYFRDTPRLVDGISGYQLLAVCIFLLAVVRYIQRAREYM
jgi:phosphatidylglycerol:prolipoprotein diacylglycerol transferase